MKIFDSIRKRFSPRKSEADAPPEQNHLPFRVNNDFTTTYTIYFDSDAGQEYHTIRSGLIEDFERVGLENPKVRFNDTEKIIELGYIHQELMAFLNPTRYALPLGDPRFSPSDKILENNKKPYRIERAAGDLAEEFIQEKDKAIAFFESFTPPAAQKPLVDASSDESLIDSLLVKAMHKCLVVGEGHYERSANQFLISNMAAIKEAGVNTLFIESIFTNQQRALDEWRASPPDTPMPREIEVFVDYQDHQHSLDSKKYGGLGLGKYTRKNLLMEAKRQEMRIVGFETEVSLEAGFSELGPDVAHLIGFGTAHTAYYRHLLMHYQVITAAQETLQQDELPGIFVGAAHTIDYEEPQCELIVPGLAKAFGTASVVFSDEPSLHPNTPPRVEQSESEIHAQADVVLIRNPDTHGISNKFRQNAKESRLNHEVDEKGLRH